MDPFSNGAGPAAQRPRLLSNRAGRAPRGVAAGVELSRLGSGRWGWGGRRRRFQHFCLSCARAPPGRCCFPPGRPRSFPTPATQTISPAANPLASSLHPSPKTIPKSGRGCRLGKAGPPVTLPRPTLGCPGLPAPPSLFPIIADPKIGQNFPERTRPALAQGLPAAPGAGQRGRGSFGDAPTLLSEVSPHLFFCSPGRGPLETLFRTHPPSRRLPS